MENTNWSALFAGDILVTHGRDSLVTDELRKLIAQSVIASCNLEAPLPTDSAQPINKAGSIISEHVCTPSLIRNAGFNVINLANNHAYDYGNKGLACTLEKFSDLTTVGAGMNFVDAYKTKEIIVDGIHIALLSFCESEFGALTNEIDNRGGYAWINHPSVNKRIQCARRDYDVVLVQVHAGIELIPEPLPEWRARYKELIDQGADAVIASHPHVVQGTETYAGKPIFYSLGNFCFDKKDADINWSTGILAILDFNGRNLVGVRTVPVRTENDIVDLYTDSSYFAHLTELKEHLQSPLYLESINARVQELWNMRYSHYFLESMNTLDPHRSFIQNMRAIAKFFLGRTKINRMLLLHNLRIESHRYAIMRALASDEYVMP